MNATNAIQGQGRPREDLVEQVLDLVRSATGDGAEAEVTAETSTLALTRFANSFIHQNVADASTVVRLRLHLDGRTASGSTTRVSRDALAAVVDRAVAGSRLRPADPGWPGLTPSSPAAASGNRDGATATASPAARADVVRGFVDAIAGLEGAGYCQTIDTVAAYGNSAQQSLTGGATSATFDGIARTGSSDGVARAASVSLADIDGTALGVIAADKARRGGNPVEFPPGDYEVVLEPDAVADILMFVDLYGFNGRAVNEGRSFVRVGEEQFDPQLTIVDDATAPGATGLPFDAEGTPKHRVELVDAGASRTIVHDRRTAKEAGTETTGHAVEGGERWGAVATDLVLEPASRPASRQRPMSPHAVVVDDLVAGVDRGFLVTDFHYTRVLDPRTVVVTGLTRNGLWLIEGGEVTAAAKNLRFTQSYPSALAPGAVLGLGSIAAMRPTQFGSVHVTAPALRLAGWHFTGGASG
jgi:predicted Zn-dependent protease